MYVEIIVFDVFSTINELGPLSWIVKRLLTFNDENRRVQYIKLKRKVKKLRFPKEVL